MNHWEFPKLFIYLLFIFNCPKLNIGRNSKNTFLWYSSKPKINHKTLCTTFEDGGLKSVDVKLKIISLHCSLVKKIYNGNYHDWKVIRLYFISKYFGKNFHFLSDLSFDLAVVDSFPEFYKQIFINWSNYPASNSEVTSCIQSNFLWYNKHILTDNKPVYLSPFSNKNVNYINNLLDC